MISAFRENLEAFLSEHRRGKRPGPIRMPGGVNELLANHESKESVLDQRNAPASATDGSEDGDGEGTAADDDGEAEVNLPASTRRVEFS